MVMPRTRSATRSIFMEALPTVLAGEASIGFLDSYQTERVPHAEEVIALSMAFGKMALMFRAILPSPGWTPSRLSPSRRWNSQREKRPPLQRPRQPRPLDVEKLENLRQRRKIAIRIDMLEVDDKLCIRLEAEIAPADAHGVLHEASRPVCSQDERRVDHAALALVLIRHRDTDALIAGLDRESNLSSSCSIETAFRPMNTSTPSSRTFASKTISNSG